MDTNRDGPQSMGWFLNLLLERCVDHRDMGVVTLSAIHPSGNKNTQPARNFQI